MNRSTARQESVSRRRACPAGFTLTEALVALTILSLAGSALLLGVQGTLQSTDDALGRTIAAGIAEQLVDEIMGLPYVIPGGDPYQIGLGPNSWEQAGNGRERYNDMDDFHGFVARPIEDTWGIELGRGDDAGGTRHANFQIRNNYFRNWQAEIEVYYVDEDDPSVRLPGSQASGMRAAEIVIKYIDRDGGEQELHRLRRVHSYVPAPS